MYMYILNSTDTWRLESLAVKLTYMYVHIHTRMHEHLYVLNSYVCLFSHAPLNMEGKDRNQGATYYQPKMGHKITNLLIP